MRFWVIALLAMLVGCIFIPPDVQDAAAVSAYNAQMVQFYGPIVAALMPVLTAIIAWRKSNRDKQELATKTEAAAEHVATKTEETKQEVLAKVEENTEVSRTAFTEANNTNEKILALQRQIAELSKRAPSRSTDAPGHVQEVALKGGPGVDTPLKVEETKK